MSAEIAVFGLGNPLMTDEGIGIRVLEVLGKRDDLPPGVALIDLGTGGVRLLHESAGRRKRIFVDCARMGAPAGTLRRFRPDEVRSRKVRVRHSLHEGDLLEMLALAAELGSSPGEVVLFGIEPVSVEPGLELSPLLAERLDEYVERVLGELRGQSTG